MANMRYLIGVILGVTLISCRGARDRFVEENVEFAHKQIGKEIELIEASGKFMNPTTRTGAVVSSLVQSGICMS